MRLFRASLAGLAVFAAVAGVRSSVVRAADMVTVLDLDNRAVDPFESPADVKAIAFLFLSTDCPISNRYAPDVKKLHDAFSSRGVLFRLIYPNPSESASDVREHLKSFGYPMGALRDPRHALVRFTKVAITPEAAIYDRNKREIYRGRIDDRYVSLGVERPSATRHDVADALTAMLAGKRVPQATTQAVGCFIADFVQ